MLTSMLEEKLIKLGKMLSFLMNGNVYIYHIIATLFFVVSTMSSFSEEAGLTSPFAETVSSVKEGELAID